LHYAVLFLQASLYPLTALLSHERVKLRTSEFCTRIYRIDQNKSALTISGKVAVGVLRDCQNFQGTHI